MSHLSDVLLCHFLSIEPHSVPLDSYVPCIRPFLGFAMFIQYHLSSSFVSVWIKIQPFRMQCPEMTEFLLTGALNLN